MVDDGSTDGGDEIVRAYRFPDGSSPVVIRHEAPLGVAITRNRGVFHAKGEWIGLCDNDDLWHPRHIEIALETAAKRPDAHAIATGATSFALESERPTLEGHVRGRMVNHWLAVPSLETLVDRAGAVDSYGLREVTFSDLREDTCFVTTTLCFRRESYALAGGCAPWCYRADDWILNASVALLGPIVLVDAPLVFYRIRADSQSHGVAANARPLLAASLALRLGGKTRDRRPAGQFYNHLLGLVARDGIPIAKMLALAVLGETTPRQIGHLFKMVLRSRLSTISNEAPPPRRASLS